MTRTTTAEQVRRITIRGKVWTLRTTPLKMRVKTDDEGWVTAAFNIDQDRCDLLVTSHYGPLFVAEKVAEAILYLTGGSKGRRRKGAA